MTDRPTQAALADLKDAKRLTAELISNWDDHQPFDAQAALRMHPQLADVKSVVLDLAHEEFCQRLEKGESVPVEEFAARFPNYQDSLAQLLGLQQALNADLHLLGDGKNAAWPAAGESLFDFKLNEEIGRGAFSRVFLGTEPALGGRQVVVKVSRSISSEAATLGKLQHPNIVPVFSVRSDPHRGLAAICMPFLSRTTLFDLLDAAYVGTQSPLSSDVIRRTVRNANGNKTPSKAETKRSTPRFASYIDCAIQISVQLADALAYTHALGIFHRDIKPSNVLITETADALLFDFNLAFARENAVNPLGGTLPYMSPEQLHAIRRGPDSTPLEEIGARSDVFSLGATLYELLCGRMPFGRLPNDLPIEELAQQLLLRQRNGATPLRVRNPNINPGLASVIDRTLAFDQSQRTPSAETLRRELQAQLSWGSRSRRWRQVNRRKSLAILAAGLIPVSAGLFHAATRDPFVERHRTTAWDAMRAENYNAARRQFALILERHADNADALYGQGRALLHQRRFSAAAICFEEAWKLSRDGRTAACCAYAVLMMHGQTVLARGLLEKSVAAGFSNPAVHNNLAYCYLMEDRPAIAKEQLDASIDGTTELGACLYNRAQWALKISAMRQKIPDFAAVKRALKHTTPTRQLYVTAALTYAFAAEYTRDSRQVGPYLDEALNYCDRAIAEGCDRKALQAIGRSAPLLAANERFADLLPQARQSASPPNGFAPVVDPMSGLNEDIRL